MSIDVNAESRDVAREWLSIDSKIRLLERDIEALKQEKQALANDFERMQGVGGVVELPDLDMTVRCVAGRRSINRDAILEHVEQLPPAVKPREVTSLKWPGVADLEKHEDLIRARGLDVERFVVRGDVTLTAKMHLED